MEALQTRLERSAPVAVNASRRHVSAPIRKRLVLVERHTAEEAAGDSNAPTLCSIRRRTQNLSGE